MKEDYDGAEPSPNSIAALNLLRLAQITGRARTSREQRAEDHRRLLRAAHAGTPRRCRRCSSRSTPRSPSRARSSSPARATPPRPARCCARSTRASCPNKILLLADGGAGPEVARRAAGVPPHRRPDRRQARGLRLRGFRLPAPDDRPRETARTVEAVVFGSLRLNFAAHHGAMDR